MGGSSSHHSSFTGGYPGQRAAARRSTMNHHSHSHSHTSSSTTSNTNNPHSHSRTNNRRRSSFTYLPSTAANGTTSAVSSSTTNTAAASASAATATTTPSSQLALAMSTPGAYAIQPTPNNNNNNSSSSSSSSTTPQVYRVTIPPNIRPNQEFQVYAGPRVVRVRCPSNARPGSTVQISVQPTSVAAANESRAGGRNELGELQRTAQLTSAEGSGGGGAVRMRSEVRIFNTELGDDEGVGMEYDEDGGGDGVLVPPPLNTSSGNNNSGRRDSTNSNQRNSSSSSSSSVPAYNVTVPRNVRPGTSFQVRVGTEIVQVQCPRNAGPGDTIQFTPPSSMIATDLTRAPERNPPPPATNNPAASNNAPMETVRQVFEVKVPPGVQPGRSFALMAAGQRVLVTCPPDARPGQRIRFSLPQQRPVTTSNQQQHNQQQQHNNNNRASSSSGGNNKPSRTSTTEVVQMTYDTQDGWTRTTRVTDMKFTWIRVDSKGTLEEKLSYTSDGLQMLNKMAYVRSLRFLKGNDARMRTGKLTLIHASDSSVNSTIRRCDLDDPGGLNKASYTTKDKEEIVGYADLSEAQTQRRFEKKVEWFQDTCRNKLQIPWEEGHLRIAVRRSDLLSDAVDAIMSLGPRDLRKIWRIDFLGEEGIDAGGLAKEFFEEVTRQIFDADNGLLISANPENQMCMRINPASAVSCPEDHLVYFRFLGRVMGRALFGGYFVGGHMVQYLYKHILGWPVTFSDIEAIDSELYANLKSLMEMPAEEVEYIGYDFTVTEEVMGEKKVVELVENGANIDLNGDNRAEYLEAYLRYVMLDKVKLQLNELLLGFYDVVPEALLTVFDFQELELVLCGLPQIDIDDWRRNTVYTGLYESDGAKNTVCRWFWDVVTKDFDQEMKARLLQFVTGSSGVPTRGFEVLQGGDGNIKKFTISGIALKDAMYPRAHTCFNRIDLPVYKSRKELAEKLRIAVTTCATGFSIE